MPADVKDISYATNAMKIMIIHPATVAFLAAWETGVLMNAKNN